MRLPNRKKLWHDIEEVELAVRELKAIAQNDVELSHDDIAKWLLANLIVDNTLEVIYDQINNLYEEGNKP